MKNRANLICCIMMLVLIFGLLFVSYGYNNTWELWNISPLSPHFADLRVILAGSESRAKGYDPMFSNPCDPWNRRLNYPRIWQSLSLVGINQGHTTYIGIGLIFAFLIGVCLLWPRISNAKIGFVIAAVISPAAILCVERANNDLLMFFLLAGSVAAIKNRAKMSVALILLGCYLKLYPIFGFVVLLRNNRQNFIKYSLITIGLAIVYACITFSDILMVSETTPRETFNSYGLNVFWMQVTNNYPGLGIYTKMLSYFVVLLLMLYACFAMRRNELPSIDNDTPYLDSFRVGSAIYLGTFLIGNNFDYRLIFLIFTIPQLLWWSKSNSRSVAIISITALVSLYISLWYFQIMRIVDYITNGCFLSFLLDELSHWVVFGCLLYLFMLSMPKWVKLKGAIVD